MTRHPDAFDMQHADEFPENEEGVTCKHCGQGDLYWQDTWDAGGQRKPRLFEDGKSHVCKPNGDDFDVVS